MEDRREGTDVMVIACIVTDPYFWYFIVDVIVIW